MSATVERLSSNRVKIDFSIEPAAFEACIATAYRKNVGQINVPGFRRGKAPRKVIERMYGEAVFYEDAFDELFPTVYQAALDENDLRPVDQPDLKLDDIGTGKPLNFSVEVFVSPEVTLGDFSALTVPEQTWEVTDEQVDSSLNTQRERIARWIDITDRAVGQGDRATIDYAGSVDGVPFDGGSAEKFALEIGSGTFIPGFEEQVEGMTVGEERDISVKFPEDYRAEQLAGKDALFHVKLHEVKAKELPDLDDEFAKDVSEFDTLDEYKADIRSKLEESAKSNAKLRADSALLRAAVEVCEIDVPQSMIERQIDMFLREFQMRLAYQGLSLDRFLDATGQGMEEMRGGYAEDALARVKADLVLEALTKRENFTPAEEQVEAEIARVAADMGRTVEAFKESMTENDQVYIRDAAASEMAMEYLRKAAKYVKEELVEAANTSDSEGKATEAAEKPAKKTAPRKKKTADAEQA